MGVDFAVVHEDWDHASLRDDVEMIERSWVIEGSVNKTSKTPVLLGTKDGYTHNGRLQQHDV